MAPWVKGRHQDYTAFVIEVHVHQDRTGNLRSFHCLQGTEDEVAASTLPGSSGGMEEGALALLTEAGRAESLLQVLVKLTNEPEFQQKLLSDGEVDPGLIENLTKGTMDQIHRELCEILPHIVRETVIKVRDGLDQNG